MKIKDLQVQLSQFDPETEVCFSVVDPTDYEYKINSDDIFVEIGDPYDTNGYSALDGSGLDYDKIYSVDEETGEEVYIGPKVLIISLGML